MIDSKDIATWPELDGDAIKVWGFYEDEKKRPHICYIQHLTREPDDHDGRILTEDQLVPFLYISVEPDSGDFIDQEGMTFYPCDDLDWVGVEETPPDMTVCNVTRKNSDEMRYLDIAGWWSDQSGWISFNSDKGSDIILAWQPAPKLFASGLKPQNTEPKIPHTYDPEVDCSKCEGVGYTLIHDNDYENGEFFRCSECKGTGRKREKNE